jgi:GNAT superfamily N-acetyltransferase
MRIRETLEPGDLDVLGALIASLRWVSTDVTPAEQMERLLAGATWFAIAEVDGRAVGYVRALSDRVAVTYLAEVAVAASHRRQGIGAALIARCLEVFKNTAVFASASPEAVPLLEHHGVRSRPSWYVAAAKGPAKAA